MQRDGAGEIVGGRLLSPQIYKADRWRVDHHPVEVRVDLTVKASRAEGVNMLLYIWTAGVYSESNSGRRGDTSIVSRVAFEAVASLPCLGVD